MRVLDMRGMRVVHRGLEWPHRSKDPCARDMLPFLERNESIISWVQPSGSDGVNGQVPAIRVGDKYCTLSLRMMKSVWRHVRLKKEFVNLEPLPQGGSKLRIPSTLLLEKIRTSVRFNTMRMKSDQKARKEVSSSSAPPSLPPAGQPPGSPPQSRGSSLLCRRVTEAMEGIILPLGAGTLRCPPTTCFVFTEMDYLLGTVKTISKECPTLSRTRDDFLRAMGEAYDAELAQGNGGAAGAAQT